MSELLPFTALHVSLIGPDLSPAPNGGPRNMERRGERLLVETHQGEYLEWRNAQSSRDGGASPDLAIAFNSGCGTDEAAWREVVGRLLEERTPLVCTSFDEEDAAADARFLDACGAAFVHRTKRNAFSSALGELRTGRQGEASEEGAPPRIGYSNAFWHVIRGRL